MINMAQQITTRLVDDLDGTEAVETIAFGIDGKTYEIDLSSANAGKLRGVLEKYIGGARKQSGGRRGHLSVYSGGKSSAPSARSDREQNQAIREWAQKRGLKVSDRGRISAEVLDAYHRRNGSKTAAAAPEAPTNNVALEQRLSAALSPKASTSTPAARKPRAPRKNGKIEAPQAAPTGHITRVNKLTETMIGAVCEFTTDLVSDHGDTWVELRGNRDEVAAKIEAAQADMSGQTMTQRAAKGALTRVVKELRNVKSRKVETIAA